MGRRALIERALEPPNLCRVDILFWLVPAAVVTVLAMLVVAWLGREPRGPVDRETAARMLGEALSREVRHGYAVPPRAHQQSTGVAVRQRMRG